MCRVKSHLSRGYCQRATSNNARLLNRFQFLRRRRESICVCSEQEGFGTRHLRSDGHLITEDSVFPTTAPGGAPKRNRCYQDARYFIDSPPCARFARALGAPRTAHYAMPPLGAGAVWLIALFSGPMDKSLLRCSRWEITSSWSRVDW